VTWPVKTATMVGQERGGDAMAFCSFVNGWHDIEAFHSGEDVAGEEQARGIVEQRHGDTILAGVTVVRGQAHASRWRATSLVTHALETPAILATSR
jgi:hypothetical protein